MPSATPTAATDYEVVIGLEVHAQLLTASKMFCRCSADYANAAPNTHCCPICMGFPGTLPVINERAVEYTMMTALALTARSLSSPSSTARTTSIPTCPRATKSRNTTSRSAATAT